MWEKEIVCGCFLDHQVVNPIFAWLCTFGLYPSSCEVILVLLCVNPLNCEVIVCWLGIVPQGGGCVCKERSWVLLIIVIAPNPRWRFPLWESFVDKLVDFKSFWVKAGM